MSEPAEIGETRLWVWLEQAERAEALPVIVVDTLPEGAELTLAEAQELCELLMRLLGNAGWPPRAVQEPSHRVPTVLPGSAL